MIDNIPGAKVEEDTETHHVLAENLYKPRRRVTHTHTHTGGCRFPLVGEGPGSVKVPVGVSEEVCGWWREMEQLSENVVGHDDDTL